MKQITDYDFDIDGEVIDLRSEDRDYLLQCKLRVDESLGRVRQQVTDAKREFAATGRGSDRDWLSRAESAIRVLGKASQVIQSRLGDLKRKRSQEAIEAMSEALRRKNDPAVIAAKKLHADSFERAFVEAARVMLPEDSFKTLCRAAHQEVGPLVLPRESGG